MVAENRVFADGFSGHALLLKSDWVVTVTTEQRESGRGEGITMRPPKRTLLLACPDPHCSVRSRWPGPLERSTRATHRTPTYISQA
jgi:hypothetical protein